MPLQPLDELTSHLSHPCFMVRYGTDLITPADFDSLGITFPDSLRPAVPQRRADYLAGRWCAQQALLQLGIKDVQVGTAQNRAPLWPAGVLGTITHSHGMAFAMVTHTHTCRGIGADIEIFMSEQQEAELQALILTDAEQEQFARLRTQVACPVTLMFSAKESIFKALYASVSKYFGFDAVALTGFNADSLFFTITTTLSAAVPAGSTLMVRYQLFDGWLFTECQF